MDPLTVDQKKCGRDGICIAACPMGIIEFKSKDAFPSMIDAGEELCINCGHCVTVCPHGAMNHAVMSSKDCRFVIISFPKPRVRIRNSTILSPENMLNEDSHGSQWVNFRSSTTQPLVVG